MEWIPSHSFWFNKLRFCLRKMNSKLTTKTAYTQWSTQPHTLVKLNFKEGIRPRRNTILHKNTKTVPEKIQDLVYTLRPCLHTLSMKNHALKIMHFPQLKDLGGPVQENFLTVDLYRTMWRRPLAISNKVLHIFWVKWTKSFLRH